MEKQVDVQNVLSYLLLDLLDGGYRYDELEWILNRSIDPGSYPAESSPRAVAAASLWRSIPKKFQGVRNDQTMAAALSTWMDCNNSCKDFSFNPNALGPYDEVIIGEFKWLLYDFFNPEGYPLLTMANILPYVDHGPGASPLLGRNVSFLDKLGLCKLTASSPLVEELYYEWIADSPERVTCEIARILHYGRVVMKDATPLVFVPKNDRTDRVIKTEPLLNMFFQKGIQAVLEQRLKDYFGISFSNQSQLNSDLARIGSVDGSFSTIDLKSASDLISSTFVKEMLPKEAYNFLNVFRSRECLVGDDEGSTVLHMFATMGNAFCFPLQTVIFCCLVHAVYRALGIKIVRNRPVNFFKDGHFSMKLMPGNWGVFGDDVIVLEDAFEPVCRVLRSFGMIPNVTKSFTGRSTSFRESCGADFWRGYNVRGVYITTLNTQQDVATVINKLSRFSARHSICLKQTLLFLLNICDLERVPPFENDDAGVHVPSSCRYRVSSRYFGWMNCLYKNETAYSYWKYSVSETILRIDREAHYVSLEKRPKWRKARPPHSLQLENPAANLLAAIAGRLRGGRLVRRSFGDMKYYRQLVFSPCWDYFPATAGFEPSWTSSWINLLGTLLDSEA